MSSTPSQFNVPVAEKTLRDEFAMAALAGLLAFPAGAENVKQYTSEPAAELAYQLADAMLAERSKSR